MKKIIFSLVFSFLFAECPEGYVEDDCGDCWASYCYDMSTHVPNYQTTEEACNEAGLLWVNPGDPGDPTFNSNCSSTGDGDDHGDDDHDDHDHGDEEHCEDLVDESSCTADDHCEWHADEMACEDAEGDHDDHDHGDHDHGDCGDTDHLNVDGLILESNGVEIYRQFQGGITGSLNVHVNETIDLSVHFLDQNQNEIEAEAECYPLSFEITDPSIISISLEGEGDHDGHDHHGDDDHGDEEHNVFELTGLSVGSTTFSLLIMHQGHADFTSMPILATVEEEMVQCFSGDINNDSSLNVVDAVLMVNMILSGEQPDDMCTYDYNEDGQVNVVDVVQLVNHIIGISLSKANEASNIDVLTSNNSISIKSDGFVQGVQLTLSHGDDFAIEMADEYISDYRTNNNTTTLMVVTDGFKSVEDIANVSGKYVIEEVITSTSNASVNIITEVVSAFELKVVGPNPFNPTTKLNVVVEEAGYVSVKIYNLIGQVVATLADGYMEANPSGHTLNWDASLLSSGVYIVHAQNAGKVSTQKLTLLK